MKYTDSHEWIRIDKDEAYVGISNHAQEELGEVVFVKLPEVGEEVRALEEVVVLESTKAAADIYSPVSGTVVAINENVLKDPNLINTSAEDAGWLYKIAIKDKSELDSLLEIKQYLSLIS